MNADQHQGFQQMIDESLAGGLPDEKERSLREHLETCLPCQEYLSSVNRVVAGLGGFSFEVTPGLHARVLASVRLRAQQAQTVQPDRGRWTWIYVAACVLTVVGSFVDWQFGRLIGSVFEMQRMQLQQGLLAFWIIPSVCFLLLFPLLPLLGNARAHRNERTS
jgi:hypothetical protein